jgi:hypothetical protein
MQRARLIGGIGATRRWVGLVGAMAGLAACGSGPEGATATDAAVFVGQWSYRSGLSRLTCGGQTREVTLNGTETLARDGAALEWVSQSFGCRFVLAIDDETASAVGGQSCHVSAGSNSGTAQVDGTSFKLSSDTRTLVESGFATIHYDDGRLCTATFNGTLVQ